MESVGFKEWALVCRALGDGRQSIILRKGGIAEGRGGFQFQHDEFFLFPTFFHEQLVKTNGGDTELPASTPNEISIELWAKVEEVRTLDSMAAAEALASLHILRPEVVRERFDYGAGAGIQLAFLRVFRLEPGWVFPDAKSYGGCRSWVDLPAPPTHQTMRPVLTDAEHPERRAEFARLTGELADRFGQ
jgi:hypothetical protein